MGRENHTLSDKLLGRLLIAKKEFKLGVTTLLDSHQAFTTVIENREMAAAVEQILASVRRRIGIDVFDNIWREISDQPLPNWLS